MPKRTPEAAPLCLVTYRTQAGDLETCAVPPSQRNTLLGTDRLVTDHGVVEVGLPPKELQALLQELKSVVRANGGRFPEAALVPASPWVPVSAVCTCPLDFDGVCRSHDASGG